MSYTPGPWEAQGHKVYGPSHPESKHPNGRVFVATVAQGTHRADPLLEGGADRFGFDSEADVQLIAAAPELLEALEEIIASNPSILATERSALRYVQAVEKARKVIGKARGEATP